MYNNDRTVKSRTVPKDPHSANAGGGSNSVDDVIAGSTADDTTSTRNSTCTTNSCRGSVVETKAIATTNFPNIPLATHSNFQNEENRNNSSNDNNNIQSTSTSYSRWETLSDYKWPVDAASYKLLGKVGRGASATVYKAQTLPVFSFAERKVEAAGTEELRHGRDENDSPNDNNITNLGPPKKYCAIKVINLEHVETNFMDIRQEVQTMRLSQNENILSCYTSFIHHTNLWLVMQLMDKGSSLRCIQQAKIVYHPMNHDLPQRRVPPNGEEAEKMTSQIPLQHSSIPGEQQFYGMTANKPVTTIDLEYHITYILHQTILGLQYIHSHGQIHRDIKASNILLDSSASVRIADFGVSGWLINAGSKRENTRTFVGTPCWMAPEVMEQIHGYDTKADIWSLGITALELAKGYAPYAKYPPMKVLLMTIQDEPPGFETYPPEKEGEEELDGFYNTANEQIQGNNNNFKTQPYSSFTGRRVGNPRDDVPCSWSNSFQSLVKWCLQKDPAKRPNCEQLLNHEHFKIFLKDENLIQSYKQRFKEEICDWIPDAGDEITPLQSNAMMEKGAEKVTGLIKENMQQTNKHISSLPVCIVSSVQDDNMPSGTTWIFKDGSQVTVKSHSPDLDENNSDGCRLSGKVVGIEVGRNSDNQDFFDQFESATQGENFKHPSKTADQETTVLNEFQRNDMDDSKEKRVGTEDQNTNDDLNAFMDQFEMETGGENFLNRV